MDSISTKTENIPHGATLHPGNRHVRRPLIFMKERSYVLLYVHKNLFKVMQLPSERAPNSSLLCCPHCTMRQETAWPLSPLLFLFVYLVLLGLERGRQVRVKGQMGPW